MSYDITFRCDDTDSAIGLVTDVLDDNHDGRVRLITFTPTTRLRLGDIVADIDKPAKPAAKPANTHKRQRQTLVDNKIMRTVDCTYPGCPGRPGTWCGSANGSKYSSGYIHNARRQAAKR